MVTTWGFLLFNFYTKTTFPKKPSALFTRLPGIKGRKHIGINDAHFVDLEGYYEFKGAVQLFNSYLFFEQIIQTHGTQLEELKG